jgi:hypothetical protein
MIGDAEPEWVSPCGPVGFFGRASRPARRDGAADGSECEGRPRLGIAGAPSAPCAAPHFQAAAIDGGRAGWYGARAAHTPRAAGANAAPTDDCLPTNVGWTSSP